MKHSIKDNFILPLEDKFNKIIGLRPIIFRLFCLNVIFIFICILVTQLILINKGVSYAKENPFLYEIVSPSKSEDKLFIFKGNVENNYISYNNLLWRILRVNQSGSLTIILNDEINILPWSTDDFDIHQYLNTRFIKELDESKITYTKICNQSVESLEEINCNRARNEMVSLLDINSFSQSIDNAQTFITDDEEIMWLANDSGDKAWHTNGNGLSLSKKNMLYKIRPVITLTNEIFYEKGDGTKENPYMILENSISLGSKVKLGNDYYYVYSTVDNIKMVLDKNIDIDYNYTGSVESIMKYLNRDYYNSLSYKNLLVNGEWQLSSDKASEQLVFKNKIGILNTNDLKVTNQINDYYLLAKISNYILVYNDPIIYGVKNNTHYLRPCIVLPEEMKGKFVFSDGVFYLEEEL